MKKTTVEITARTGLCCSCGICKNVCPKGCIRYRETKGVFVPAIDLKKCIRCGLCGDVCPGIHEEYQYSDPLQAIYGDILASYNAWSKNAQIRHVSASGGCVSTIILKLLELDLYDAVFALDSYSYDKQLKTQPLEEVFQIENSNVPKSRYLPVSHEYAVDYIKNNKTKKVILIGTSCALRGLRKTIELLKLNQENYLFIGLFCDKVFNYHVNMYFADWYAHDKEITALHFKNKESGGWPGNMKLFFKDGSFSYLDKSIRGDLKDYFVPERCLYCIDKLNVSADLAFGDNYTNQNSSSKGSNSVIIRTQLGERIWNMVSPYLVYEPVSIEKIGNAQYLDGRLNNLYFSKLKMKKLRNNEQEAIHLSEYVQTTEPVVNYAYLYYQMMKKSALGADYPEAKQKMKYPIKKRETIIDCIVGILYRIQRRIISCRK